MLSTRKTKVSALLLENMSQFSSVLHTSIERARLCVRLLDLFKLTLPKTILKSSKDIGSQSMAFYPCHYIVIELVYKCTRHLGYKYDGFNTQIINLDFIISIISVTFNFCSKIYILNNTNASSLDDLSRMTKLNRVYICSPWL